MASKAKIKAVRRPNKLTAALRKDMLGKISDGYSVRRLCIDRKYPTREMFYKWLREYPDFQEDYKLATELRADALVDEMLDIADDDTADFAIEEADEGYSAKIDQARINRAKVKIDTRKWIAARMAPKKYGNNLKVESENKHDHSGTLEIGMIDYSKVELDDDN